MAEREYGPPCPGCTHDTITAQIERFPRAYSLCIDCRDHGALYHAKFKTVRDQEDAQERESGQIGLQNGKANAKG